MPLLPVHSPAVIAPAVVNSVASVRVSISKGANALLLGCHAGCGLDTHALALLTQQLSKVE